MPLVFLSVQGWDNGGLKAWKRWAELLADQGYESLHITLDPHEALKSQPSSEQVLGALESELVKQLLTAGGTPFPPILFASSASCLIAETYVSSHALSGLFLHEPATPLKLDYTSLALPSKLKADFTYEPNFPLAVTAPSSQHLDRSDNRLWLEFGQGWDKEDRLVDFLVVASRDEKAFETVTDWMNDAGL